MEGLKDLYHLPWSDHDNPNWWIEPTTYCQLKCVGCYRGLDTWKISNVHLPIEVLKKQIDSFVQTRNVQTISIAGWEPLLYPHLEELLLYIKSKNLYSMLYTNGMVLNQKKLTILKEAWLTQCIIHISPEQDRPQWKGKDDVWLMQLRNSYVDMFRQVGGVGLWFIMPLFQENISSLDAIVPFARKNIDIVNLLVFTVWKDVLADTEEPKTHLQNTMTSTIVGRLQKMSYTPGAYLPKLQDKDAPAWLMSIGFGSVEKYIWDISSWAYKVLMERYHKYKKKYFITKPLRSIKKSALLKLFISSKMWKDFGKQFFQKTTSIYPQTILIIDPPRQAWDWCDGCPDVMYIWDALYPSCMINNFEPYKEVYIK